jgi:hypothetical protein
MSYVIRLGKPGNIGEFREKDFGHWFTYIKAVHYPDGIDPVEWPHLVDVGENGENRFARVLKTVAYVIVDEDENGPVVEKWALSKHNRREA